jgi:hypothetical protein
VTQLVLSLHDAVVEPLHAAAEPTADPTATEPLHAATDPTTGAAPIEIFCLCVCI